MVDRITRPEPQEPARPVPVRWGDLAGLFDDRFFDSRFFDGSQLPAGQVGASRGDGFDLLRKQMPGLDPDLSETIAARLAHRPDLPHDIALNLALERIGIARPVLRSSPVLTEADLMEVIDQRSREHHLAIARRNTVAPLLTEILVEMGDHDVLLTLLENPGAQFHRWTVARLIGASRHDEALRAPLLRRRELTRDQAQILALWVANDVRQGLKSEHADVPAGLPGSSDTAHRYAALQHTVGSTPVWDRLGMPTPDPEIVPASTLVKSLIAALRQDNIPEIESIIARLTGLPPFAVDRILYNVNPEPLAIICRALSLKRPLFAALFARLQRSVSVEAFQLSSGYRDALVYFTRLQATQAARVLETWQRAPVTVWHNPRGWKSSASWAS